MERVCKKALPRLTEADGRQPESMADIPKTKTQGVANPGVFFISTVNGDEEPNPDVASSAARATSIELHPSLHPSSALSAMSIGLTSLDREERGHADSESLVSEQQEQFRGMFSCALFQNNKNANQNS